MSAVTHRARAGLTAHGLAAERRWIVAGILGHRGQGSTAQLGLLALWHGGKGSTA